MKEEGERAREPVYVTSWSLVLRPYGGLEVLLPGNVAVNPRMDFERNITTFDPQQWTMITVAVDCAEQHSLRIYANGCCMFAAYDRETGGNLAPDGKMSLERTDQIRSQSQAPPHRSRSETPRSRTSRKIEHSPTRTQQTHPHPQETDAPRSHR